MSGEGGPAGRAPRASGPGERRREIMAPGSPQPFSHYTDAVVADGFVFVSGCVPIDGEGRLVGEGDVQEQTRQVFRNISAILAEAGATLADVVKVTLFLTHIGDRAEIDVVRKEVFGAVKPASTLVEVSRLLVPGARLEIECVALGSAAAAQPTERRASAPRSA